VIDTGNFTSVSSDAVWMEVGYHPVGIAPILLHLAVGSSYTQCIRNQVWLLQEMVLQG
jgi:hypothetical protein